MQFKHPELLYALFALIIPILVHLFQLRRFQKRLFSNVQFLKSVTIQTRKSSQIKKWLILATRLCVLACIIIAFAQPFLSKNVTTNQQTKTAIYLDNSFSMQLQGAKGPLLQRAVQELLENIPENEIFSIFTNTKTFAEVTKKDIQTELLQIPYVSNQISYETAYLKAKKLIGNTKDSKGRIVMISDFQQKDNNFNIPEDTNTVTNLVQLHPATTQNISIDSLYLKRNESNELTLDVSLSNTDNAEENTSVAFYNGEKLMGKTAISIPKNGNAQTFFIIDDQTEINGRIIIQDRGLVYDNSRYFNINKPKKIKVLTINESDDFFLKRIFTKEEFNLSSYAINDLNYSAITDSNLVILNEITSIPISLINALRSFQQLGGTICIIPAQEGDLGSYQQLINAFSTENLKLIQKEEKKITSIEFAHPLFRGVFDKKVTNFQYPKVNSFYTTNSENVILGYEDKRPFLYKTQNVFVFTAALNKENSNFQSSPLIVPTFYNIGKQSLQLSDISYIIGQNNTYDIPIELGSDHILSLSTKNEKLIPLQQSFPTKVRITTSEVPLKAGIYTLKKEETSIQNVSYNYDTKESILSYYSLSSDSKTYTLQSSVQSLFDQIKDETKVHELWKWFIIFALIFIGVELLLLKFLK